MHVLSFVNQKGGCGKTTASVHLAGALARRGARTLLVDLDPQAHATLALGCAPDDGEPTSTEILERTARIEDAALAAPGGVWLLPATARLAEVEDAAARTIEPERALATALEDARELFDFALVDCPPRADGVLTANALRASSTAVLVVETGAFALQGAVRAERILGEVSATLERPFDLRVLATMFDRRLVIARDVLIALQARFGPLMYETAIRESVQLRQAAALGAPVQVTHPGSRAVLDFDALASEVLARAAARPRPAPSPLAAVEAIDPQTAGVPAR